VQGGDALPPEVIERRRALGVRIAATEAELREVEAALDAKALYVPNLPNPELPDGDASHNRVVRPGGPRLRPPSAPLGARRAAGDLDLAAGRVAGRDSS
jgi:seryl-tRNA synthetase